MRYAVLEGGRLKCFSSFPSVGWTFYPLMIWESRKRSRESIGCVSYPPKREWRNCGRRGDLIVRSQHFTSGDHKRARRKDRTKIKRVKSGISHTFNKTSPSVGFP